MKFISDKELERIRYDKKNLAFFSKSNIKEFKFGLESIPLPLRDPYIEYYKLISELCEKGKKVLEIGAGYGLHSKIILDNKADLIAADISKISLKVLNERFKNSSNLKTIVCDMENIDFVENTFDLVVSAGSLSYGDNKLVMENIYRVLKPGGTFLCVDSLNENFIYKLNRFFHFLRGNRSFSTIIRMPTIRTLEMYKNKFSNSTIKYYGSIIWLIPFFRLIIDEKKILRIINLFDNYIKVRKSAFKFVMKLEK